MKLSMTKWTLAGLVLLSLGACGQQKESKSSSQKEPVSSKQVAQSSASKETSASEATSSDDSDKSTKKAGKVTVDQGVSFNGSYYSVQGKSGDIVIANKH